uniref:BTB domain-containing protein n=1 Tax=Panagrolaimus sp. PS1159 TaxID=55785 RepID=A0AC35FD81_9BILA
MVKEIHASFIVSVKSAQYEVKEEAVFPKTTSLGNELCNIEELFLPEYKFFVNGIMEIELEATLKARGIKRKAVELCTLANVLWESDDKDLTIIAEEQELKVHKWVISAKSPVFKAELNSGMKEAIENTINITDFSFECVKIAMEFFYERNITQLVNERNASQLLHFADKYDIKLMHSGLQTLLIKELSALNVCHFANISLTSNADELKEYCVCFLMNATKKEIVVKDSKKLDEEILKEIGRRSLFSLSE